MSPCNEHQWHMVARDFFWDSPLRTPLSYGGNFHRYVLVDFTLLTIFDCSKDRHLGKLGWSDCLLWKFGIGYSHSSQAIWILKRMDERLSRQKSKGKKRMKHALRDNRNKRPWGLTERGKEEETTWFLVAFRNPVWCLMRLSLDLWFYETRSLVSLFSLCKFEWVSGTLN